MIQEIKDLLADESDKWRLDADDWIVYVEELVAEVEKWKKLCELLCLDNREIADLAEENLRLKTKILELQDFVKWMTGCGYDFAELPYFRAKRDKLLKT
ncbi:hypothetical protein GW796_09165 [archaeon]|nr:hypothetical protein [archaeon]NCT58900.1 hypothetical protein [archaeon]